ncbi:MAG: DEAD/DEAH box helicase [Rhodocyclales bacterium]|nr:DEAD/DEAH box helicase [Rhodocyclales bacterium]
MNAPTYTPGSLVRARGRDWVVLPTSEPETLHLRPLSGSEADTAWLHLGLEPDIRPAHFDVPSPEDIGNRETAGLLADALTLSLRRGAGPFRSFGNVGIEPRSYQLVPLLMALKLDPVRLLIADDVGIGKTIEALLIARELFDRGEIQRFAVLCPPHLVEQWVGELTERFHFPAVAVTAASAARLERGLPVGVSLFEQHPVTVVSLDYIKSQKRRDEFARASPELVIVDEAHTCSAASDRTHLRYALLKELAADAQRHLVLLTATPHSGDEQAFYRLLALLKPAFEALATAQGEARDKLRQELAAHYVQRRRPDIDAWHDDGLFPRREVAEATYRLSGHWERFFEDVLDYCATVTERAGDDSRRQRLTFWGTLALMRCVSSSPAAAAQALTTRRLAADEDGAEELAARVFDGSSDALPDDDVEPGAGDASLGALLEQARRLEGERDDPKLARLVTILNELLEKGHAPVVFCRYIATAHYLGAHLRQRFPNHAIEVVTGELPTEERRERAEALGAHERRLLIATDCLSEGVNLQQHYDAVVHYDLSWNPTRHEQREGRVDRFGQPARVVRAVLLYGENNPVDGAVLNVILRKAEAIRRELGVPVPLPDDDHSLTQALLSAVLLRRQGRRAQQTLDFGELTPARDLDLLWTDLAERTKANRTVFAQRGLKPEEVLPEWQRARSALGDAQAVRRFVERSLARLGAAPEVRRRAGKEILRVPLLALPPALRERLAAQGLDGRVDLDFAPPAAPGCSPVHRAHPLVATLAEHLLEFTLDERAEDTADPARLGRTGAWVSPAVTQMTTVLLLRLRHQLTLGRGDGARTLMVEEALPVALLGRNDPQWQIAPPVADWFAAPAGNELAPTARKRFILAALDTLAQQSAALEALAAQRAELLLADHRRVRDAARARGEYQVRALLPVDVIAVYVLLPEC